MKLELPMVVSQGSPRLVEAWLPHLDIPPVSGPSLAALRDDLALAVMLAFERAPAAELWRYQLAPHTRLRHVDVKLKAHDRERGVKLDLSGTVPVLLEKWPADDFWLAVPTRLQEARFAVADVDALEGALTRRLAAWFLAHGIDSLEPYAAKHRQRLDILDVDADPPTILPRTPPKPAPRPARRDTAAATAPETPLQREERRRRARLQAETLRAATRNLSHAATDDTLERAYGREGLVRRVLDEILGRDGVALVLVGPSGAGKTAIVHEMVRRLAEHHGASGTRRDVWRIDGSRFIAGQSYVGQWEARARALLRELAETGDLLYADDLTSLAFAGRTRAQSTNLAQFLEPALARGEIALLGECTLERWTVLKDEAPGFANLFHVLHVPPLDAAATLPVLLGVLRERESAGEGELPPRLAPGALEILVTAAARFRPHEVYPGRAVRLLERVLAGPGRPEGETRHFDATHVWAALRAETGLPDFVLGAAPPRPRDELARDFADLVAGQPEAVDALVQAVLALQAGLGDPDKPLATYLLVGPTGVGKTETAKALARVLFGSPDRLLRFDMSELTEPASLARLVGEPGAPDGELTSALRAQPLRVILFDEIEKAHPRVFDALLQLMGEGRLTDAAGRTADARQATILMTSNLGVREAAARPGFIAAADEARQHYLSAVRAFFRPEFFNRIDRVVPYAPLDRPALRAVVERALADLLGRRGIRRANVLVDVEPALLDLLVEQAFDPRFGARPLRRALERRLTVPLAHHLVTRRGDDLALVELFRGEEGLGLAVRLLEDAAALVEEDGPETWRRGRIVDEIQRLRARAEAYSDEELAPRLEALDDDALAGVDYAEEVREPPPLDLRRRDSAGHMGLRGKPGYVEHPVHMPEEALLKQLRPEVAALRDGVELAEHRAATGAPEAWTLFVECAGPAVPFAVSKVFRALGHLPAALERWGETADGWQPEDGRLPLSRRALSGDGPGLGAILEPFVGWALVDFVGGDGVPVTSPVRIARVAGLMPGAVAAYEALIAGERDARRRGETGPPGVVVYRPRVPYGPLLHVATGRSPDQARAIVGAHLRRVRHG